ncbi:hypothetical protein [Pantoea piersonii]|jgi:hypothetical protein|uniref:hypothetical protein n=1 Tax=Pantoea piersonii TaxID=2364647 RepID=UPI000EA2E133|nr:hypothetical protein [Pantoea piersonii]MBZ6385093.1 hypothetical protein [Pantoea piersonii]MBZ6385169.1 hypothetical protein [Pantoea piersonii]MBZ6398621.1 hypothetical protein [Pantoea piersonii]MBZ6398697.1 hypothetical protein [Pantoea piersonii]MBZ6406551.1 hypothetical protein [Pantoea piersonii]
MMQFTEEQKAALIYWLKPQISELEAVCDEIPFGLDEDDSVQLQVMKIALAALTAEPVGYIHNFLGPDQSGSIFAEENRHYGRAVYTAPPAPALRLPDSISLSGDMDEVYVAAWNDCISEVKRLNATAPQPVTECWTHNLDADAALVMLDRIDTLDPADDGRIEDVKRIIRKMAAAPKPSTN